MQLICSRSGDRNDCYSTYSRLYQDPRDDKFFVESGHHWAGLGEDTLNEEKQPMMWIEENITYLTDEEAERVEKLLS
jgi:hypothetical protein